MQYEVLVIDVIANKASKSFSESATVFGTLDIKSFGKAFPKISHAALFR